MPPEERLAALRFLLRVQERDLARTRAWIRAEEQRAAEHARRRPPPPPPDWAVEYGPSGRTQPLAVHTGECWRSDFRMRPLTREQALEAITRRGLEACIMCRPDAQLGVLD